MDAATKKALATLEQIEQIRIKRLRENGIKYYVPNAMQYKAHQSKAEIILFVGGNRSGKCLGKETKVYDPILGKEREVGSIGSDFHVLAYDGTGLRIAKAQKPFRKTIDKIYKVTLSNGGEFTCSMSHVVLTSDGFRTISDVQVGSELFLPQTILEPFQSTHVEDGPNSYRKAEDSRYDYRSLCRLCDVLLQREEDNVQDVSPLQPDVQEHTSSEVFWHMGVQGNTLTYNQSYLSTFHLSNQDDQDQTLAQLDGILFDASCKVSKSSDWHIQTAQQSTDEFYLQKSKFLTSRCPKVYDSSRSLNTSCVVVTSIVYVRNDYKWDFTVPIYHNYFAGGCVHHNSTYGAVELTWHLTRNYPEWFPKERRFTRPIKAVVVSTDNAIIEKVIEPKIKQYLPLEHIDSFRRVAGNYLQKVTCKDGSTVDFLTGEQDDMAFESQDWDFYWGDEPQKKRKFDAIMRGLVDRGGKTILTFTPLIEPWMKEQLVDKAGQHIYGEPTIDTFIVDMRDNKFDINGNPILTEENIQKLTSLWDDDTKETRLHGKFFHLRGIVYNEFADIHKREFDYSYPDPVIAVLDPHDRQPHHVIWAVIDRHDDIYVHSELSIHCTVDELAQKMRKIEAANGYKMKKRLIDPNFGRKPLITTGRNMIQELSRSGCGGWFEADDAKDEGRLKVKEYLHYDRTQELSLTNSPKIFFHRQRVPLTIHSIQNHQYEEWLGKIGSEKDPKEKSKDKDTHGADCIRYLCMSNPQSDRMRQETYELESSPY